MKTKVITAAMLFGINIMLNGQIIHIPEDQPTIQAGINAAYNGDTIIVAEGVFYENIDFIGKAITVASQFILDGDTSHISNTVIDGSQPSNPDQASVVIFKSGEDTSSVICGFTITGGSGTYLAAYQMWTGGGILCYPAGAKIIHNYIQENEIYSDGEGYGAGILCDNGTGWVVIRNNKIRNNIIEAYSIAEGAAISSWSNVIVDSNEIIGNISISNSTLSSSGLVCRGDYYPEPIEVFVQNNYIANNMAVSNQYTNEGPLNAGLGIADCSGLVASNMIVSNEISGGAYGWAAGILLEWCDISLILKQNVVAHNTFSEGICYGGGICINQGSATLIQNLILDNEATYGGGLFLKGLTQPYPVITNNTICLNHAEVEGGGLYLDEGEPVIRNTIFWENIADVSGNEIKIETGGIDIQYSDIEEGWPGDQNIDDNPLFENPDDVDFHLTMDSPCIDEGDSDFPNDPDESICDMGAFYFDHREIIALPATDTTGISFVANWQSAQDATGYLLDVAVDEDFTNYFFQNLDVGNVLSYQVEGLDPQTVYYYRIRANYHFGRSGYSYTIAVATLTSIDEQASLSEILKVYPNPTFGIVDFQFSTFNFRRVSLKIYDLHGREVATLLDKKLPAGEHVVRYYMSGLPEGVYVVRVMAGREVAVGKIVKMN